MKETLIVGLFLVISCVHVAGAKWCNETKTESKVEYVQYEEVVNKRKPTVMCRIKGLRDRSSCFIKETVLKERPEFYNVTTMVPKCCDGFILDEIKGCLPICDIHCDSGFCSSPNICHDHQVDTNAMEKADVDYYDANEAGETSTLFEEESSNESSRGIYSESITTTTEGSDDETNESTTTMSSTGLEVDDDEGGDVLEQEQTETRKLSWILWVSVSAFVLAVFAFIYVCCNRLKTRSKEVVEDTVSYKK